MYEYRVTIVSPETELRNQFVSELGRLGIQIADRHSSVTPVVQQANLTDNDVVLLHLPTRESLRDLQQIISRMPAAVIVVATGVEDARWLAKCVRNGASQIMMLPLRHEEFDELMDRIAKQIGAIPPTSQIIVVAGAQGGQGATFVACNLAAAVAEIAPYGVLLADMSVNFGAVANYLDIEPQYSTMDLLASDHPSDVHMVTQALHRFSDRIQVLAAPADAIGMRRAAPQQIESVITALRLLGQVVILDVPCTYDLQFFTYLAAADRIVMLVEKKVPAVRALTRVAAKLIEQGYSRERIIVTINRDGTGDPALKYEDIANTVGLPIRHTIPNDYPVAAGSMNMGKLLSVYAPQHPIWQRIKQLAELLMHDHEPAKA